MSLGGHTMDQDNNSRKDSSLDDVDGLENIEHENTRLHSQANRKRAAKSSLDFKKYTKQIWLAGLGAFSRAEEEGNKLFDALVKVGEELESSSQQSNDNSGLKSTLSTSKVSATSHEKKDKVERILDQGVHHSLSRIGLVTAKDIQHLESLILQLHQKVDQLATDNIKLRSELKILTEYKE